MQSTRKAIKSRKFGFCGDFPQLKNVFILSIGALNPAPITIAPIDGKALDEVL